MSAPKIGECTEDLDLVTRRDAFHVPGVLAIEAPGNSLHPGDSVRFTDDSYAAVELCFPAERHGIVDPFITEDLHGLAFWVILSPDKISGLRHHFDITVDASVDRPQRHRTKIGSTDWCQADCDDEQTGGLDPARDFDDWCPTDCDS